MRSGLAHQLQARAFGGSRCGLRRLQAGVRTTLRCPRLRAAPLHNCRAQAAGKGPPAERDGSASASTSMPEDGPSDSIQHYDPSDLGMSELLKNDLSFLGKRIFTDSRKTAEGIAFSHELLVGHPRDPHCQPRAWPGPGLLA